MNYQVALQEEFTQLGLMPLIEELAKNAPPDLAEQVGTGLPGSPQLLAPLQTASPHPHNADTLTSTQFLRLTPTRTTSLMLPSLRVRRKRACSTCDALRS
jgi:hypothetical protein